MESLMWYRFERKWEIKDGIELYLQQLEGKYY